MDIQGAFYDNLRMKENGAQWLTDDALEQLRQLYYAKTSATPEGDLTNIPNARNEWNTFIDNNKDYQDKKTYYQSLKDKKQNKYKVKEEFRRVGIKKTKRKYKRKTKRENINEEINKYEETNKYWTIESIKKHPNYLYIFSENNEDKNKKIPGGNQAIIRGQKNAYGIRTGYKPGYNGGFRDNKLLINKKMIKSDINKLKRISKKYKKIIYSSDGFGTGIFNLPEVAPLTYKYLYNELKKIGIKPTRSIIPI